MFGTDPSGTDASFLRISAEEGPPEGYRLTIAESGIRIEASDEAGAHYAVQTLHQLLPASSGETTLPCGTISDWPKFPWRGFLLDVSRHFFTSVEIKHLLDLMAMHKLNVFHWHLTDDGGWRMESKRYPNLTEHGAWRTDNGKVWDYMDIEFPGRSSGKPFYGGFYTQSEIRDIVSYAAERSITVLPEIDIPGHSTAAVWSYPEVGCTKEAAQWFIKETGLRAPNVFCAGKEASFEFLEGVLDEVLDLFPSRYIHIGGDEVDKGLWKHCADCQRRMSEGGLANEEELQSYFIGRIEAYLNSKGRDLVGWDEILEGGLAPNATVMSWRSFEGGIEAAKAGHDVVMTPYSHAYFDLDYSRIPVAKVAEFNPIPPELNEEEAQHVLGGQANLWTEWVPDMEKAELMTFPRLAPMCEALWLGEVDRSGFDERLAPYCERLKKMGVRVQL